MSYVSYSIGRALVDTGRPEVGNRHEKSAAIPSEYVGEAAWGPASGLGSLAGMLTDTRSPEEQREASDYGALNLLPGVGAYNLAKRRGRAAKDQGGYGALVSEHLGVPLSIAASGGLGGLIGSQFDAGAEGALLGAGLGAGSQLLGFLGSGLTETRDREDMQQKNTTMQMLANLLVPGVAGYEQGKRLGYTRKYDKQREEDKERDLEFRKRRKEDRELREEGY